MVDFFVKALLASPSHLICPLPALPPFCSVALLESCGWTITYDESRSALARTPAPHSALAAAAALTSAVKPRSGRLTGEQLPLLGHGVRLAGKH